MRKTIFKKIHKKLEKMYKFCLTSEEVCVTMQSQTKKEVKIKMNKREKVPFRKAQITREQCDLINLYCEQNGYSYYALSKVMHVGVDTLSKILIKNNSYMAATWNTVYAFEDLIRDKKLKERKIAFYYEDKEALQDTEENVEKYGVVGGPVTSYKKVYKHLNKIEDDFEEHGYCILDAARVEKLKYWCDSHRKTRNRMMFELGLNYPTIKRIWDGGMRVTYATYQAVTKYMDEHGIYADDFLE